MRAPGGPGVAPGWGPGRKQALGAAPGLAGRVWFTIAGGNLSQVFYPAVDRPLLHSVRFIAAAPGEVPFDDAVEGRHDVQWLEPGIPCFRVESRHAEYTLTSEFVPDPETEALVVSGLFRPELPDLRLYLQAALQDVADGQVLDREPLAVAARQGPSWMVLIGPFGRCSAGYLGSSDLVADLRDNDGEMTVAYSRAARGHVGLGAELSVSGGPFQLALGFGTSLVAAEDAAHSALARGVTAVREGFVRAWRAHPGPDRSLLKVAGDGGALARSSMAVLRCLEDKQRPGAFISAPTAPWGEVARPATFVCNRDLYHVASALLDAGDQQSARRTFSYLEATQCDDGSWPLRSSVNGTAQAEGTDLGQVALPVLLAWRLGVVNALDRDPYPRLVRRAAGWLVGRGPLTEFDRWMDAGPGYSPSSLAAAVAALLAAAEFADDAHEPAAAEHLRVVADYWQESIEQWTFLDAERRYVRLAADPGSGAQPSDGVGLEFVELVRRGLRQASNPRVLSSLARADGALRVLLPQGRPGWRRFTGDAYGEAADGSPWSPERPGLGHAWPVLIGERAHLALAAGEPIGDYLRQLEWCAGPELLLPEQVWDGPDLPERGLTAGRATGSGTPSGWAHAEYLRLLAACARSSLPDLITPVRLRYVDDPPRRPAVVWHHGHRLERLLRGRLLRVQVRRRGAVAWTADGWATSRVVHAHNTGLGCWVADLATEGVPAGAAVEWTVSYADGRWEGESYRLTVEGPMARSLSLPAPV